MTYTQEKHSDNHLRLKVGLRVSIQESNGYERVIIGNFDKNIELQRTGARKVISYLDGSKSVEEITALSGISRSEVDSVISILHSNNFLDTRSGKIILTNRFHSSVPSIAEKAKRKNVESRDPALQLLHNRLTPELSEITWCDGVEDGGVEMISARQEFEVEIYGSSRIAVLLYGILLGSGVTNTHLGQQGIRDNLAISHRDIGATFLRVSDVGANFRVRLHELAKEFALFPLSSDEKKRYAKERTLKIFVGDPSKDELTTGTISKWMRDEIDFFLISTPQGGGISWGPLVIPGKTPCLRCISISREEQGDVSEYLDDVSTHHEIASVSTAVGLKAPAHESSVASAHEISGRIAHALLGYIDGRDDSLIGSRTKFAYGESCNQEHITYSLHPRCGCSWK